MFRAEIRQSNEDLPSLAEDAPLLQAVVPPKEEAPSTTSKLYETLKVGFHRTVVAGNIPGVISTVTTPFGAFPNDYPTANRVGIFTELFLMAGQLALQIADDRKIPKAQEINKVVSSGVELSNTFTFTFRLYISLYLLAYSAINRVNEEKVMVDDNNFFFNFVLVTAAISIVHGVLDYTKENWQNKKYASFLNVALALLEMLYKSSNLNSFLALFYVLAGLSESGSVNNYTRFLLFQGALLVGSSLQLVSMWSKNAKSKVDGFVNTASAITYGVTPFVQPSRSEFNTAELGTIIGMFALITFSAMLSAKMLPPKNVQEEEPLQIQEQGQSHSLRS